MSSARLTTLLVRGAHHRFAGWWRLRVRGLNSTATIVGRYATGVLSAGVPGYPAWRSHAPLVAVEFSPRTSGAMQEDDGPPGEASLLHWARDDPGSHLRS